MQLLFLIFFLIAVATAMVQYLSIKIPSEVAQLRKLLHVVAILACAAAVHYYADRALLANIFLFFSTILFVVVHFRLLNISKGQSWGIALFPLAFGVLLHLTSIDTSTIVTAMLVLAISDAAAGWIGSRYAQNYWMPLSEQKSVLGSLVFFATAFVIISLRFPGNLLHPNAIPVLVVIAALATFVEMFSWRGSDNFWIPIVVAISLDKLGNHVPASFSHAFLALVILAPALWLLYRTKRWLDASGSVAAWFMAVWVVYFDNYKALVMPIVFLAIGSIASRLNERSAERQGRNAHQVFANGGPGMLLLLLGVVEPLFMLLYPLVFVIAGSDTLSSEVGKYLKQPTFDIVRWRRVPVGLSGGISVAGTLAGLVGSGVITVVALFTTPIAGSLEVWLIYTTVGFGGMLVDSVLGSILQAKYSDTAGQSSDNGSTDQLAGGYAWCTNDTVNWLSILVTLVLAALFILLVGFSQGWRLFN